MERFPYQPRLRSVGTVEGPNFRVALGWFVSNIAGGDERIGRGDLEILHSSSIGILVPISIRVSYKDLCKPC